MISARRLAVAACVAALLLSASCAHAPPHTQPNAAPAPADEVTVGLWSMDDSDLYMVADSGRLHTNGTAGIDTRPAFGRYDGARTFTRSLQSFVFIPYVRAFDIPLGFTIEAWVNPRSFATPGETPIAARWTPEANTQSWVLSVIGRDARASIAVGSTIRSTGYLVPGQIAFSMLPAQASDPQVYVSTRAIELGRWNHVAVSYDGMVVRIYLDGRLDSQYAIPGGIRSSPAPLLLGNWFDPRDLTDFEGRLRVGRAGSIDYAFDGSIDDVRLSNVTRTAFPYALR